MTVSTIGHCGPRQVLIYDRRNDRCKWTFYRSVDMQHFSLMLDNITTFASQNRNLRIEKYGHKYDNYQLGYLVQSCEDQDIIDPLPSNAIQEVNIY